MAKKAAGPERTCIVCRRKAPQHSLLRLAMVDGSIMPDPDRGLPGRGAYICRHGKCAVGLARLKNRWSSFKRPINDEQWAELINRLEQIDQPGR